MPTLQPDKSPDLSTHAQVDFTDEELRNALKAPLSADAKALFAQWKSPEWETLKVSEQLMVYSKLADLCEKAAAGIAQTVKSV